MAVRSINRPSRSSILCFDGQYITGDGETHRPFASIEQARGKTGAQRTRGCRRGS